MNRPFPEHESEQLLSAGAARYDCRSIFHVDKRIEVFRATEIGKMNDVVRRLCNFASHFLYRSQVQLDRFARAALKDASDAGIRLQGRFS